MLPQAIAFLISVQEILSSVHVADYLFQLEPWGIFSRQWLHVSDKRVRVKAAVHHKYILSSVTDWKPD